MSMTEWAKKEIEIACTREPGEDPEDMWDYGRACYESALKAFISLCEDGHSEMSIRFTKNILNRLIDGKPLTPIEDTEDIWENVTTDCDLMKGKRSYQCKRMSSLFKNVAADGTITYSDVNRYYCVDYMSDGGSYTIGLVCNLLDDLYPISMPYMPLNLRYKVICDTFLVDPANGDFDTCAVLSIVEPTGKEVLIQRYFKAGPGPNGWVEIDNHEYFERMKLAAKRKEELNND